MELFRALAVLTEPPGRPGAARVAEALGLGALPEASEYTDTFVFRLYPYASVYLGAEGMMGGEARDRVAGFLAALGQQPPAEPDHLALMLGTYARLAEAEENEPDAQRREYLRGARRAFLWEHLLSWLPVYLDKLAEAAPPFYRRWGELLRAALDADAEALGSQESLPLHLREAPVLADPRAPSSEDKPASPSEARHTSSSDEFLRTLLAPARSGMIIVRDDLARVARTLGVGLRAGERLYALRSLVGQDAAGVLARLAEEAERWRELHLRRRAAHGQVADWWAARATSSARLLRELSADAGDALKTV
ncbi:MAG TPA: molecular chaperone TorD family protein [Pyrinomonadaceae bacterium]|nr:molecular chaperone TorD family protein [Pyrinomonadaceae bacterium]